MALFRQEAIDAQRKRLFGEVTVHQPVRLQVMCYFGVISVIAICTWLALAQYERSEDVVGWVTPRAGVAQVYAAKSGVVTRVYVSVDQPVYSGQTLATLSLDEASTDGSLVEQLRSQMEARLGELDTQMIGVATRSQADLRRARSQAQSLKVECARIAEEIRLSNSQLEIDKQRLSDDNQLAEQGYISKVQADNDLQQKITHEQALLDLKRLLEQKLEQANDALATQTDISTNANSETSQIRASKSALSQGLAQIGVRNALVVTAPIAGRVAAVNVKAGDEPGSRLPLFAIAPDGGPLEVELLVPTADAGFMAVGQNVRMAVDAFPSERFGMLTGKITVISRSPITPGQIALPVDLKSPAYRVTAALDGNGVRAYGMSRPLRPGMTLRAYVTTARLTFLEWMLEPLLAAH